MSIRIFNARILTMEKGDEIIEGEIHIKGRMITHVGEKLSTETKFDREIDAEGNLIMPGFKNCHSHSAMTRLRSYADDLPLQEWLNEQIFPAEKLWVKEYVKPYCTLAIMEYLSSGITATMDMYLFPYEMAAAAIEAGYRLVLCGEVNDFTGSVKQLEDDHVYWHDAGYDLITHKLGFHAEYTTSKEILNGIAELAHRYKRPVCTHSSETQKEVENCIDKHGATPTAFLTNMGLFDYGGVAFHSCHLTDDDINIYRSKGIIAVTNPSSNLKLASGIPRLSDMMQKGVKCSIGTDGSASNNCLDMFREMFLVSGLQKHITKNPQAMPAQQVLRMATLNGSDTLGLRQCRTLAKGQYADMIMIDLNRPNMRPINNITKNLVYSGSKENVKLTMVNGKILYKDGIFNIGVDPQEVYTKVDKLKELMK